MKTPIFSFIIPHAPGRKLPILNSLENLDYSKDDYELIIEAGLDASTNRNQAMLKSKGKILAFVDDDCTVPSNWLNVAEAELKKADIVGGPNLTPASDKGFAKISGYALSSKFGCFRMHRRYTPSNAKDADERDLTSTNLLAKREVYEKIGGFKEGLFPNEENEWLSRAKKAGFRIKYSPTLITYHHRRETPLAFSKQFQNSGNGRAKTFFEGVRSPVFFIPSIFLLYILVLPFLPIYATLPLVAYLLLDVFFSISTAVKERDLNTALVLPFIFPLLHFSYAIGFLKGLWEGIFK